MKARELKHIFHRELDNIYGKNEVDSFFFMTSEHYFDVARIQLALDPEFSFAKSEADTFFNILEELKQQKPIQYILGETEFYGLKFKVNPYVLIPRPETEELVDWILKSANVEAVNASSSNLEYIPTILDIGTGSGCIAISLAKHLPKAKVYALDVSNKAIEIAKQNANSNKVDITFIEANILNESNTDLLFKTIQFDIIVSNPPYVRLSEKTEMKSNVLDNEPDLALFVEDEDPLIFYKSITDFAVNNLKPKGHLYFEINQYLGEASKELLVDANFENIELRKDLNGNDRMLKGQKR